MGLQVIGEQHAERVVEVLEELLSKARAGRTVSFAYLTEGLTETDSESGVVGRYRADPNRCLGDLVVMKERLARYAATRGRGFASSK